MTWTCEVPFHPSRNYTNDREHDGNLRKWWFMVLRAGLYTLKKDAEFQAAFAGPDVFRFPTRAEAEAYWAANCRKNHLHAGLNVEEGEGEHGSPPRFPTPAPTPPPFSTPVKRESPRKFVRRESRASVKREARVKDEAEEREAPLFREDDEVSPLSRPRKRPLPPSVRSRSPRTPGLEESPTRASTEISAGSISSVSSLSTSVASSASRAAFPLRSGPDHPPPSKVAANFVPAGSSTSAGVRSVGSSASRAARPAASHLHAGSSGTTGTGAQPRRHAEQPVLFNKSTRTLYKDAATAVREMGKGDSVQVLEVEDLEVILSAPRAA
ncbi:hypothetical protein B0H19DRAFT_1245783 [Mycena capillaripes]|nr:hypothetical protein B0H19DRAFT_1245783 [Mycena capillaripes]